MSKFFLSLEPQTCVSLPEWPRLHAQREYHPDSEAPPSVKPQTSLPMIIADEPMCVVPQSHTIGHQCFYSHSFVITVTNMCLPKDPKALLKPKLYPIHLEISGVAIYPTFSNRCSS